jgi:hypothetical protein
MAVTRVLGRAAAVAGALIIVALLAVAPASAASAPQAAHSHHRHAVVHTVMADKLVQSRDQAADAPLATSGGLCGVPGIGDIGSLIGLCQFGSSGAIGALNNICSPGTPEPEYANSGLNTMIDPPGTNNGKTLYDNYGVSGQFWAAYGLECSDMTSLIGNNVAGMVFDMAKSLDRVTITIYQAAAGNGILGWLQGAVDKVITALGNAVYFPYLAPVVILGAIWLAWQGLIRKRATRTIEGTIWMVLAAAAAIWLIGRPADFTGVGTTVSNGVTQVLNVAFAKLPATQGGECLPVAKGDPQSVTSSYAFTSANGLVDQNANELWSVLVCEPWLDGELGTTAYATSAKQPQTVVNQYGRALLWSQAIANNEQPTNAVIQAKQATYVGIAKQLQAANPATYALFQGKQWTTRLEIGFAGLFAAVAAGLLILLIALTLIVLKLGFLLLLVLGPFFLILGTHPGFGRIIAIRWFEMLAGVLMKQVAIALVLSVLLYCYSLIMGTSDAALPWALKIMMIALVTVAVFIYRRPFQHLFSAVGYGMIGSTERAEYSFKAAGEGFRRSPATSTSIPGMAARWARRNPATAAGVAATAGAGVAAGATLPDTQPAEGTQGANGSAADATSMDPAAARLRPDTVPTDGEVAADGSAPASSSGQRPSRRSRNWPLAGNSGGRSAPPLPLPPQDGSPPKTGSSAGWARGPAAKAGAGTGRGSAPARSNGGGSHGASSNGGGSAAPSGNGRSVGAQSRQASAQPPAAAPPANGRPATPPPMVRRQGGTAAAPPVRRESPGNRQSWPGGSGWFDNKEAPAAGPGEPPSQQQPSAGDGTKQPLPFWLRPVRRGK